jgi:O-antigen/teichoic acid export membrane protein
VEGRRILITLKDSVWISAERVTSLLLALLLNAWLFRQLGAHGFGLLSLGLGVAAFAVLANFGLPSALNRAIALGVSSERARKLVATALLSTMLVGGLLVLLMSATAGWLGQAVFSAMAAPEEVAGVLRLSSMLLLVEALDSLVVAALRGAGRERVIALSELLFRGVHTLAVGLAALFNGSVDDLLGVMLLMAGVRLALRLVLAQRALGFTGLGRSAICFRDLVGLFEFGRWQWLKQSGSALYGSADRLLFGGLFGSVQLAHYTLCVQLAYIVFIVPAALLQPSLGHIARATAGGAHLPHLGRDLLRVQMAVFGIALLVLAGSPWVLTLLMGVSDVDGWMLVLAVLASTLMGLQVAPNFILLGAGENRRVGLIGFFGSVATLLLCWLVHSLGPVAFMAARCLQGTVAFGNYPTLRVTLDKLASAANPR